jgi:C4-dicarboxylate-specific signal transduction histidine kinase
MRNERPICHRAEDLVTYLYGEAAAEEARDFTAHMQQCDACRAEFSLFNRVHESIVTWRNEALGSIAAPAPVREDTHVASAEIVQHARRLPARAALREFFSVSPLWLRGATAFAGLLLCALLVFAVSRMWRQSASNRYNEAKYTEQQFQQAVEKQVAERVAKLSQTQSDQNPTPQMVKEASGTSEPKTQVATDRNRTHTQPRNRLTREERVQLAADLGLIPGREDETPFVLPDEPNQ